LKLYHSLDIVVEHAGQEKNSPKNYSYSENPKNYKKIINIVVEPKEKEDNID